RDNFSMALRNNVIGEAGEGGTSGATGVDNRSDSRIHAGLVRMDSQSGKTLEDVSVQVDQTGRDYGSGHLDHPPRLLRRNLSFDVRNFSLLDRDILNAVETC